MYKVSYYLLIVLWENNETTRLCNVIGSHAELNVFYMKTNTIFFLSKTMLGCLLHSCCFMIFLRFVFHICLNFCLFKDRFYSVSTVVHANVEKMT